MLVLFVPSLQGLAVLEMNQIHRMGYVFIVRHTAS
jgi:hypothetical protein